MVVISRIGNKKYKAGMKVRVRYPSMTSGYIQYTFISKKAGQDYIKNLPSFQKNRAKITKA